MTRAILLISHSALSYVCSYGRNLILLLCLYVVKLDTMVQARVDLKNKSTRPQKAATSIPHNSSQASWQTSNGAS